MKNKSTSLVAEAAITVGCFTVAFLVLFVIVYEPAHTAHFWFGNKPGVDVVAALATPIIAIAAATVALLGYRANKAGAASARFQKGVELLGKQDASAHTGGIAILQDVAGEYRETYLLPAAQALCSFVSEQCAALWREHYNALADGSAGDLQWPHTPNAALEALTVLSHTPADDRWPVTGFGAQRAVRVFRPYLCGWKRPTRSTPMLLLRGVNFTRLNIDDGVFRDVVFEGCRFEDCEITGLSAGVLRFEGGSMSNCTFDIRRRAAGHTEFYGVAFSNARWSGKQLTRDDRF